MILVDSSHMLHFIVNTDSNCLSIRASFILGKDGGKLVCLLLCLNSVISCTKQVVKESCIISCQVPSTPYLLSCRVATITCCALWVLIFMFILIRARKSCDNLCLSFWG